MPFIRGHWMRGPRTAQSLELPNPTGICQCGCGQEAPRATMTNVRIGHIAGEHVRFIRGHVGYLNRTSVITPDKWHEEDRGYSTPCWIWNGRPKSALGYCEVTLLGKRRLAHRAMYEQEIGTIPTGLQLDHLCRQPSCINPRHLEPVTQTTNVRRGRATKLTVEGANFIRTSTLSMGELTAIFGVSRETIRNIRNGTRWKI